MGERRESYTREERAQQRFSLTVLTTIVVVSVVIWTVTILLSTSLVAGVVVAGVLLCLDAAAIAMVWYRGRRI